MISPFSQDILRRNVTLVNSHWTGKAVQEVYGIDHYEVVYPPIAGQPSTSVWGGRQNGFLLVPRIDPDKRVDHAISILQEVRKKGFDISLRIIGRQDDPQYWERIKRLCQENRDWLFADGVVSREELSSLMSRYKYGINAAFDEPFGMAVAEMVKVGGIVFVPNGGGQTEIVSASELIFHDDDDAVEKITNVLRSESLQETLLDHLRRQGEMFSTEMFCQSIQGAVREFFESR